MTDEPRLRVLDHRAWLEGEQARLDALDLPTAAQVLADAVRALAEHEADRLHIGFMDPTYHGCEPAWRAALYAASDLRTVLERSEGEE